MRNIKFKCLQINKPILTEPQKGSGQEIPGTIRISGSPTSLNVVNDLPIFRKSEGIVSGTNKPKRLWTETDTEIAKSKVVNKARR